MTRKNRIQFTDRDGDTLSVSTWPVLGGRTVFETRLKDENVGAMAELTPKQARKLIEFLESHGV